MAIPLLLYAVAASLLAKKVKVQFPTRAEVMAEKRAITRARLREEEAQAEREKLEATRHAELLAAISATQPERQKKKTASVKSSRRMSTPRQRGG